MEPIIYTWKDRKRILGLPITFTRYRLSEDRLFLEKGFFNIKQEEVLLYRVRDLELHLRRGDLLLLLSDGVEEDEPWAADLLRQRKSPDGLAEDLRQYL